MDNRIGDAGDFDQRSPVARKQMFQAAAIKSDQPPTTLQTFLSESSDRVRVVITRLEIMIERQEKQLNRLIGVPIQGGVPGQEMNKAIGHLGFPPASDAMSQHISRLEELAGRIDQLEGIQSKAFELA